MEPKLLAALVSSLISQALLSVILKSSPLSTPSTRPLLLPPLLLHLISTSQIAAANSLLSHNRKRKRTANQDHQQEEEVEEEEEDDDDGDEGEEEGEEEEDGQFEVGLIRLPYPNPDPFKLSFRMSSSTFEYLSGLLDPLLDDCRDAALLQLPSSTRLAVGLSRLSSGLPYPLIASRFSLSLPSARFLSRRLCRVLLTNFRFFLSLPPSPFAHFPLCSGALSSPRFALSSSSSRSLSALILSDPSSKILYFAAGFSGDRSDVHILQSSSLYKDVNEKDRILGPSQILVGDGDFPLHPWLMVPFRNPASGTAEEDFNTVLRSLCGPARRAVSSLKSWGVVSRLGEEDDRKMAVACIATCAILHNVLLIREDYSMLSDAEEDSSVDLERCGGQLEEELEGSAAHKLRRELSVKAREIRNSGQFL